MTPLQAASIQFAEIAIHTSYFYVWLCFGLVVAMFAAFKRSV